MPRLALHGERVPRLHTFTQQRRAGDEGAWGGGGGIMVVISVSVSSDRVSPGAHSRHTAGWAGGWEGGLAGERAKRQRGPCHNNIQIS